MTKQEALQLIKDSMYENDKGKFTDEDITQLAQRILGECSDEDVAGIFGTIQKAIDLYHNDMNKSK